MEDRKEFKVDKGIRSGDLIIDEYITGLEEELTKRADSSIYKMVKNADMVASVIADDFKRIAEGRDDECVILNDSKDDKRLERVLSIIKSTESFKALSTLADSFIPEIVEVKDEVSEIKLDKTANIFEQLQEEHYKKNKKKG